MLRNTDYRQNIAYGYFNILQQIFINLLSLYLLLFFMHAQVSSKIFLPEQRMCCNLITRRSCPFKTTMSDLDLSLIKKICIPCDVFIHENMCALFKCQSNLCQNENNLHSDSRNFENYYNNINQSLIWLLNKFQMQKYRYIEI